MQPNGDTSEAINAVAPNAGAQQTRPGGDMVFRNESKNSKGMILGMIVLALLAAGGVGFGVWAYLSGNHDKEVLDQQVADLKQQNNELSETILNNESNSNNGGNTDLNKYCEGTYYGEASGTSANGISYDLKYKYVLNNDGTFTADFGGTSGTEGVYSINGNTISLIGKSEIGGPEDEATAYVTNDYIIADDCSYIKVVGSDSSFVLNKE